MWLLLTFIYYTIGAYMFFIFFQHKKEARHSGLTLYSPLISAVCFFIMSTYWALIAIGML